MKKENKKKIENSEDLEKKILELAEVVDRVEDEKLEIENQLKKALADYHNLLKNIEKREEMRVFSAKKSLCENIIPTLDSVMLAIESGKELKLDENSSSWMEGIVALLESLKKGVEGIGLKQYVPAKGDVFDNNIHEAVATVPDGNSGEIFDIIQPGYVLNDIVIRPARVVVSK